MTEIKDSAYTLRLEALPNNSGRFRSGHRAWNKGLSWSEQGMSEEKQKRLKEHLKKYAFEKGVRHGKPHMKPVVQYDDYGYRLHWYESSEAAARKIGCAGRNIRQVCDGRRKHAGGFVWKWDSVFT